ncbi:MAG: hypothetical protein GY838_08320 [bacterium]|nr:hypothetical protein [bacterium]
MSRKSVSALTLVAIMIFCTAASAQEDDEQPFSLQRESSSAAAELELTDERSFQHWEPAVKQGTLEVSFGIGFLNLNSTLLSHEQIIYKYTTENTYFGDVEIKGGNAFSPSLRIGGNISRWFALEGIGAVSFSDYDATVENRKSQKNEPGSPVVDDPPLGEFDAEKRSLLTGSAGIAAVIYPFNFKQERVNKFQPYLTGGVARMWYNMNSNFSSETASTTDLNAGLGLRILADRNISIRMEAVMHRHNVQWTPNSFFTDLEGGTVQVPLEDWPVGGGRTLVTEFESNDITAIGWTISAEGSF